MIIPNIATPCVSLIAQGTAWFTLNGVYKAYMNFIVAESPRTVQASGRFAAT